MIHVRGVISGVLYVTHLRELFLNTIFGCFWYAEIWRPWLAQGKTPLQAFWRGYGMLRTCESFFCIPFLAENGMQRAHCGADGAADICMEYGETA